MGHIVGALEELPLLYVLLAALDDGLVLLHLLALCAALGLEALPLERLLFLLVLHAQVAHGLAQVLLLALIVLLELQALCLVRHQLPIA
jgi:hypothetical protein